MPGLRLEWGPPGGPRIEALGPEGSALPDLLEALLKGPAVWDLWYRSPAGALLSGARRPLRGAAARLPAGFVLAFRYHPGADPLSALKALEPLGPPPQLLAACLGAAKAERLPVRLAPWAFARLAGDAAGGPAALGALLLGRRPPWAELVALAGAVLEAGTLKGLRLPDAGRAPAGAWNLILLGAAALELKALSELKTPAGVVLPVGRDPGALLGTFAAWAGFVRGDLSPEAFAFFYPEGFRPPRLRPPAESPAGPPPGDLSRGLKAALLKAAESAGPVRPELCRLKLLVPFELKGLLGDERTKVLVEDWDLWVFLPRPGLPVRWEPEGPGPLLLPDPALDLVFAALWHDLKVGGPGAFPRAGGGRRWGSYAEWALARRASAVRPHLRRLPRGKRPTPRALSLAEAWGLVLPRGYTFVGPHLRGGKPAAGAVRVRARGLVSLLSLGAAGVGTHGRRKAPDAAG
jgi:hypothetical protein